MLSFMAIDKNRHFHFKLFFFQVRNYTFAKVCQNYIQSTCILKLLVTYWYIYKIPSLSTVQILIYLWYSTESTSGATTGGCTRSADQQSSLKSFCFMNISLILYHSMFVATETFNYIGETYERSCIK